MLVDLNFSEIMVAVGTIALAIVTFVLVIQNRSQLKILKNQNVVQKISTAPHLVIKQLYVNKNKITITLENIGGSLAKNLGLSTTFNPMFKSNDSFHLIPNDKFEYEGKLMKAVKSITFLKTDNNFSNILGRGENRIFTSDELFFELKEERQLGTRQFLTMTKLVEFLKKQNIAGFALTIGLVYKDLGGNATEVSHSALTFDITKHITLEECFIANLRPYGLPLSFDDIEQTSDFFDGEFYMKIKTANESEL